MTTHRLELPMQGEPAAWLRALRRGEVAFDDWWARSLQLDASLEELLSDEALPDGPDRRRIEAWSVRAHLAQWASAAGPPGAAEPPGGVGTAYLPMPSVNPRTR
ncbi:MAG TPA: hypothetical protein VMD59_19055 [Acidimicrobiales bacterium]|nr:hypothetical protein [Acidimicrobiales bacterium]